MSVSCPFGVWHVRATRISLLDCSLFSSVFIAIDLFYFWLPSTKNATGNEKENKCHYYHNNNSVWCLMLISSSFVHIKGQSMVKTMGIGHQLTYTIILIQFLGIERLAFRSPELKTKDHERSLSKCITCMANVCSTLCMFPFV